MFHFLLNDAATTEIYTLSLHDALPIYLEKSVETGPNRFFLLRRVNLDIQPAEFVTIMGPSGAGKSTLLSIIGMLDGADRKSTRLNSSHSSISYAVFCLKKKKETQHYHH